MSSITIGEIRKILGSAKIKNSIPVLVSKLKRQNTGLPITQDPIDIIGQIVSTGRISIVYAAATANLLVVLDFPDVTVWVIPKFNKLDDAVTV